jgi:hypothetical protein
MPDVEDYLVAALRSLRLAVQAYDDAIDAGREETVRDETRAEIVSAAVLFGWVEELVEEA